MQKSTITDPRASYGAEAWERETYSNVYSVPGPPFPGWLHRQPAVLPPRTARAPQYTLVLDIDGTMTYTSRCGQDRDDVGRLKDRAGKCLYVYDRPFLKEFLKRVARKYELIVYTAAAQSYAEGILTHLNLQQDEPVFNLKSILHRDHCLLKGGYKIKCLAKVGRDMSKTIFLEDNQRNAAYNWPNVIYVNEWSGAPDDNTLEPLLPFLEAIVDFQHNDVRPVIQHYGPISTVYRLKEDGYWDH
eukprot:scpid80759/ scgid24059/ CTD small phosphatase-like protein 2